MTKLGADVRQEGLFRRVIGKEEMDESEGVACSADKGGESCCGGTTPIASIGRVAVRSLSV